MKAIKGFGMFVGLAVVSIIVVLIATNATGVMEAFRGLRIDWVISFLIGALVASISFSFALWSKKKDETTNHQPTRTSFAQTPIYGDSAYSDFSDDGDEVA